MHYYQFNIGDYASHTRHLDLLEDLAYRRILDLYYLHERPLNGDATFVAKQIGMKDKPAIVRDVLNEFFEKTDDGYVNSRADKEIANFHSKIEQASRAGKASAERRLNARSTDEKPNIKQEPITKNQEPKKKQRSAVPCPIDVDPLIWDDWLQVRKAKRAGPVTETVLQAIKKQASIVNWTLQQAIEQCAARGWQGFHAEWVSRPQKTANAFPERNLAAARAIFGDERNLTNDPTIIESVQTIAR